MVDRSRIWRGPCRAPGRLVVPPSQGTPTMPISTSAGSRNSGRRMKVATSPKRGTTVPETGWGKSWLLVMPLYGSSLCLQKGFSGRHEFLDGGHEALALGLADHDVECHEAAPRDPDAGSHHVEIEQLLGVLAAGRDVGRGLDRPRRGMRRHHRADAGELERHLVLGADRVQPLAYPLTPGVQLRRRRGRI